MQIQINSTMIIKMPEVNYSYKSNGRVRQLSYRYNISRERQSNILSNPTSNITPKSIYCLFNIVALLSVNKESIRLSGNSTLKLQKNPITSSRTTMHHVLNENKLTKSTITTKFISLAAKKSFMQKKGVNEEMGVLEERDGSINVIKIMKFRKPSTEQSSPKRLVGSSIDCLRLGTSHTKSGSQSNSSLKASINPKPSTDSTIGLTSAGITLKNKLKLLENKVMLD
jgi:hypothetical protein